MSTDDETPPPNQPVDRASRVIDSSVRRFERRPMPEPWARYAAMRRHPSAWVRSETA